MYIYHASVNLVNVALFGNTVSLQGGGIFNDNTTLNTVNLTNVTMVANFANQGSGMFNNDANMLVYNSIIYGIPE